MEVSGTVHAPAALPHAKEPAVSIELKAGHFAGTLDTVCRPAHDM